MFRFLKNSKIKMLQIFNSNLGKRDNDVNVPREQYSYSIEGGEPRHLSSGEPLT